MGFSGVLCRWDTDISRAVWCDTLCSWCTARALGAGAAVLGGRVYPKIQDGNDRRASAYHMGALRVYSETRCMPEMPLMGLGWALMVSWGWVARLLPRSRFFIRS